MKREELGFLIEPKTTSPGMAPPLMGWALPHSSLIKKNALQVCLQPDLMEAVSRWKLPPLW